MCFKLTFLGTGGGRYVTASQLLSTGGFIVETDQKIQIDPGPGAIRDYRDLEIPFDFSTIFLSHDHIDHLNDVNILLIGATEGNTLLWKTEDLKKKVNLVGTSPALDYVMPHLKKYCKIFEADAKSEFTFGKTTLHCTPAQHSSDLSIGVIFEYGGKRLWYSGDTKLIPAHNSIKNLDVAVLNVAYPKKIKYDFHISVVDAIEWAKLTQPKQIFLRHFGMRMINAGPDKIAREMTEETGIPTIAAKDGMFAEI